MATKNKTAPNDNYSIASKLLQRYIAAVDVALEQVSKIVKPSVLHREERRLHYEGQVAILLAVAEPQQVHDDEASLVAYFERAALEAMMQYLKEVVRGPLELDADQELVVDEPIDQNLLLEVYEALDHQERKAVEYISDMGAWPTYLELSVFLRVPMLEARMCIQRILLALERISPQ